LQTLEEKLAVVLLLAGICVFSLHPYKLWRRKLSGKAPFDIVVFYRSMSAVYYSVLVVVLPGNYWWLVVYLGYKAVAVN